MNLDALTELLVELPGVGRRQAGRLALWLAKRGPGFAQELMRELENVHNRFRVCSESYQIFFSDDPSETRSPIARDPSRSRAELLIIEKDADIEPLEKAGYRGHYFVLGALIPMTPRSTNRPRIAELSRRLEELTQTKELREIIFGLSWNNEAEHTRNELLLICEPFVRDHNIIVTTLGRGLSTGSELEYADRATLQSALKSRQKALD